MLLAIFSLNLLPVRYTSVMLLVAAFVLLILEAKFATHGVLAAAGILSLVIGALTLVDAPIPELRVHLATALSTGLAFGLITVFLLRLAIKARRGKSRMGGDAMIGQIAVVTQPLAPSGQVMVNGELWQAESAVARSTGRTRPRARVARPYVISGAGSVGPAPTRRLGGLLYNRALARRPL